MKPKLSSLQAVRGLAALSVCFFHSRYLITIPGKDKVIDSVYGFLGVPIFFVISGFIMNYTTTNLHPNKLKNVREFLAKRLIRVLPLFYFALLGMLLIYHNDLVRNLTTDIVSTLKIPFFIPPFTSHQGPAYGYSMLAPAWTLNYEMLFYLLFAISLLFSKYRYWFLYALFAFLIIGVPLIFAGYFSTDVMVYYPYKYEYLNFVTNPTLALFILGVVFGSLIHKVKLSEKAAYLVFSIAAVLFLLYYVEIFPISIFSDIFICGGFVFSILLLDFNTRIKIPKALLYLGDISYSLYLFHWLVYMYLPRAVARVYDLRSHWYFVIIGMLVAILVASVTYELIEKRLTRYLKQVFF